MPAPEPASPPAGVRRRAPRVVPAVLLTGLVLAVAVSVVPGARTQLALSTQRRDAPFVDLAFSDPSSARRCEQTGPARAPRQEVRFEVRSHLHERRALAFRVEVARPGRSYRLQAQGRLATTPGDVSSRRLDVRVPHAGTGTYRVAVVLPDQRLRIALRCPPLGAGGS